MSVKENVQAIRERIRRSAEKSGRRAEDICLIGVSKTVDVDRIRQALDAGIVCLGENRVQEMRDKQPLLPENVQWHMIGRLQKNKVKYIIGKTAMIQSLCSIEVASEIQRISERENVVTQCLVQVNVGREATKGGVDIEELSSFLQEISRFDRIIIKGLMAVPPALSDPEAVRPFFACMKRLYDGLPETKQIQKEWLSMGMSGDFDIAIEEGANMVRVGSSIFGERVY